MTTHRTLICLGGENGALEVRQVPRRAPAGDEIEVAVAAASVNPIDAMRARGYGRRLLSLKGAGKFPMVLGNDFAGVVTEIGARVTQFRPGQRVYGFKPTSAAGTHASHVIVKAAHALAAPEEVDLEDLAVLPYCFGTMFLAVRAAGLTRQSGRGRKVLVHGAAGGLGILALQMLSDWGAEVTAIARPAAFDDCRAAGAATVLDATRTPWPSLSARFDATLNFATWDDEAALLGCLHDGALGHATTVHPLLRSFDEAGFAGGLLRIIREKKRMRAALPKGVAHYAWVLAKPDTEALAEMDRLVQARRIRLPIGLRRPLAGGSQAYDHVRNRGAGRAVILP